MIYKFWVSRYHHGRRCQFNLGAKYYLQRREELGRRTWKHQEWGEVGGGGPARSPGKALDPAETDVKPPPAMSTAPTL